MTRLLETYCRHADHDRDASPGYPPPAARGDGRAATDGGGRIAAEDGVDFLAAISGSCPVLLEATDGFQCSALAVAQFFGHSQVRRELEAWGASADSRALGRCQYGAGGGGAGGAGGGAGGGVYMGEVLGVSPEEGLGGGRQGGRWFEGWWPWIAPSGWSDT